MGDGITDLETRPVVDAFVAYAGVVARDTVIEAADAVVRSPSLTPILVLALGGERPLDPTAAALFDRGAAYLHLQAPNSQRNVTT